MQSTLRVTRLASKRSGTTQVSRSAGRLPMTYSGNLPLILPPFRLKWSLESGRLAEAYPKPLKGYEPSEGTELYGSV